MSSVASEHRFSIELEWTGAGEHGTTGYRDYRRDNLVRAPGKADLPGSSAKAFHGDPGRWNPEELLVAALAECHMLSYLHSAVRHGIVVVAYADAASGTMRTRGQGGAFAEVTLRPVVTIASGDPEVARAIHAEASANCFIASSVSFPVRHEPTIQVSPRAAG